MGFALNFTFIRILGLEENEPNFRNRKYYDHMKLQIMMDIKGPSQVYGQKDSNYCHNSVFWSIPFF